MMRKTDDKENWFEKNGWGWKFQTVKFYNDWRFEYLNLLTSKFRTAELTRVTKIGNKNSENKTSILTHIKGEIWE